ncbi:hypothetical protein [Rhodococcus rhodnii]|uniref:hypothetical protein n=1 Tax=Rhodococcus rhodnii TaxID=38312 RepID=UPI000ABB9EE2|nr:hypothetical protein [Rhodococcus rhodnii]
MSTDCRAAPPSTDIGTITITDPGNPLVEARFVRMTATWPPCQVRAAYLRAVDALTSATKTGSELSRGWARGSSLSVSHDELTIIVSASCIESEWEDTRTLALAVFEVTAAAEGVVPSTEEADPAAQHTAMQPESDYAQIRRSVMSRALAVSGRALDRIAQEAEPRFTTAPSTFAVIGGNM